MSYNTRTRKLIKKNISSYGETLTTGSYPGRIYKIISLDKATITRNNIFLSSKKEASPDTWAIESYYDDNVLKVLDDDSAYITTGLMSVGEVYNKKHLDNYPFFLRELTTGQSIKIYYRRMIMVLGLYLKQ